MRMLTRFLMTILAVACLALMAGEAVADCHGHEGAAVAAVQHEAPVPATTEPVQAEPVVAHEHAPMPGHSLPMDHARCGPCCLGVCGAVLPADMAVVILASLGSPLDTTVARLHGLSLPPPLGPPRLPG